MLLLVACTVDNGLKGESDSVCTVELGEGTKGGATDGCGTPLPPDWNLVELWSDLSYPSFWASRWWRRSWTAITTA